MRRYLDDDLKKRELITECMKRIYDDFERKYRIDLHKLIDDYDNSFLDEITHRIGQEYLEDMEYEDSCLDKMRYQNMDVHMMGLLKPLEQNPPFKEISFEEWKQQINYIVRIGNIFELDYEAQYFLSLKYLSVRDKKYRPYDKNEKKGVKPKDRLSKQEYFPMRNADELPEFIKKLQEILFTQKYIRVFDFEVFGNENEEIKRKEYKGNIDITRFSYKYIKEIYKCLREGTEQNSDGNQDKEASQIELENLYYYDNILGVSLTNIIFNYIIAGTYFYYKYDRKKIKEINSQKLYGELFSIVEEIGRMESVYGRYYIAQIVFSFLAQKSFNKKIIQGVYQYLKENIDKYNHYYNELCDVRVWEIFHDIKDWSEDYKNEVLNDLKKSLYPKIESFVQEDFFASIPDMLPDSCNDQNTKYTIRKMKKISKADNLYAQIHEAVMKGIWEKK